MFGLLQILLMQQFNGSIERVGIQHQGAQHILLQFRSLWGSIASVDAEHLLVRHSIFASCVRFGHYFHVTKLRKKNDMSEIKIE